MNAVALMVQGHGCWQKVWLAMVSTASSCWDQEGVPTIPGKQVLFMMWKGTTELTEARMRKANMDPITMML